jgi:MFS family permease
VLGQSRDFLLAALIVCTALAFLWVPVAGHLSDRFGRRRFYVFGGVFSGLFGFLYFGLLDTGSPLWIFVAISLSLIPVMTLYGPQAALIAEAFSPRLRYSGAGIGYQLASIVAGGPAPFIAAALFAAYHSGMAIACYLLACGVITIIAVSLLPDYTNKDVSREYDEARALGGPPVDEAPF